MGKQSARTPISTRHRSGLELSISPGLVRRATTAKYVSRETPIYLGGVLEDIAKDILEVASEVATEDKRKTISNSDVNQGVWRDSGLIKSIRDAVNDDQGRWANAAKRNVREDREKSALRRRATELKKSRKKKPAVHKKPAKPKAAKPAKKTKTKSKKNKKPHKKKAKSQ